MRHVLHTDFGAFVRGATSGGTFGYRNEAEMTEGHPCHLIEVGDPNMPPKLRRGAAA
jgi:hypothetical protein